MREFKFRAWNTETNNWVEGLTFVIHTTDRLLNIPEHVVLQQFTGLLDAKGQEIYEGDIVHSDYYNANFEVRWCDGKGEFLRSQIGWILSDSRYNEPLEAHIENDEQDREEYFNGRVIGNIYETPDLLKKEQ